MPGRRPDPPRDLARRLAERLGRPAGARRDDEPPTQDARADTAPAASEEDPRGGRSGGRQ